MAGIVRQAAMLGQQLHHQLQRLFFFFMLLMKGRISLRKLRNLSANISAYRSLREVSGASPAVVLFDVSNRCNLYCQTCRRSTTDVVDLSGQTSKPVALGDMSLDRYKRIIDDLHQDMLLATLYVSGEPLLNREIVAMVKHTSLKGVASMLSTNGMLLSEGLATQLLDAGLDYLKVAISGFTREVYGVYHKGGDVELVLDNVAGFERVRKKLGKRCLVVIDYILFEHNRHEEGDVRRFCRENGISFSLRYGRTLSDSALVSPAESRQHYRPKTTPCDWLWKIMVFCHDGRAVPCCQFATCAESPFVMGIGGEMTAAGIWNGSQYRELRRTHARHGRTGLPLCDVCFYAGIDFQS